MENVSIEVRSGAARFPVTVRAKSIRRAVELVEGHYPGRDVRVKFPSILKGHSVEQPTQRLAA